MGQGARLFSIAGIPIRINASWLAIYALITWSLASGYFPRYVPNAGPVIYWLDGLIAALLLFVSVLLHELSHAFVARAHGVRVNGITLHVFGGVSEIADEPPSPRAEVLIAVVGPLTSFAIAGALWLVHLASDVRSGSPAAILGYLVAINLAVGAFNLVPGFPLDGGRLLRAALWRWMGGLERATHAASAVGRACGVGLMVLGLLDIFGGAFIGGMWLILIGFFLQSAASASDTQIALRQSLGRVKVSDVMARDVVGIPPRATVADVAEMFWQHHFESFPVVDGGVVRGIVSLRDVRGVPADRRAVEPVGAVMHPLTADLTLRPGDTLYGALSKLVANGVGRAAVLDGERLVGYLSIADVTRRVALDGLGRAAGRETGGPPAARPADRAA